VTVMTNTAIQKNVCGPIPSWTKEISLRDYIWFIVSELIPNFNTLAILIRDS
jgi:hypothetical protein